MKTLHFVLAGVLAFALVACCSCRKGKKNAKPLTETTWSLVEWNGQPFSAKDNYSLVFQKDEARFGGVGDCNSIMGEYTVSDKGRIELRSVASTRAFCPDQEREDSYIRDLEKIDSYRIDGDMLMLMRDGELLMVMEALPAQ